MHPVWRSTFIISLFSTLLFIKSVTQVIHWGHHLFVVSINIHLLVQWFTTTAPGTTSALGAFIKFYLKNKIWLFIKIWVLLCRSPEAARKRYYQVLPPAWEAMPGPEASLDGNAQPRRVTTRCTTNYYLHPGPALKDLTGLYPGFLPGRALGR